jgi:hypothetical protein|tara:strand:- start:2916 stop:3548 length:633 start_codon:yes stop_codon:yes gene_type:complete
MKQLHLFKGLNTTKKLTKNNNLTQIGSSAHSSNEREINDFYQTPSYAVENFLDCFVNRDGNQINLHVWEPSCGLGAISEVLKQHGHIVTSTDFIDRGYGQQKDFLICNENIGKGDIITNPPFKIIKEYLEKALSLLEDGQQLILLMRLLCLEGQTRNKIFQQYPIKYVYIHTSRIACSKPNATSIAAAMAYAWFVWEKGYKGDTIIKWLP